MRKGFSRASEATTKSRTSRRWRGPPLERLTAVRPHPKPIIGPSASACPPRARRPRSPTQVELPSSLWSCRSSASASLEAILGRRSQGRQKVGCAPGQCDASVPRGPPDAGSGGGRLAGRVLGGRSSRLVCWLISSPLRSSSRAKFNRSFVRLRLPPSGRPARLAFFALGAPFPSSTAGQRGNGRLGRGRGRAGRAADGAGAGRAAAAAAAASNSAGRPGSHALGGEVQRSQHQVRRERLRGPAGTEGEKEGDLLAARQGLTPPARRRAGTLTNGSRQHTHTRPH